MNIKETLLVPKERITTPVMHYGLRHVNPLHFELVDSDECYIGNLAGMINAKLIEYQDMVIHEAIVKEAIKDGVSDLYILDKKFIFDAIREKMEREGVVK